MPKDHEVKFKVVLRGTRYTLTKSQIEFDGPNYFTLCFLGDFSEVKTRLVDLSRSPQLFLIILDYLCGYTVLPLNPAYIIEGVSEEIMVENLRADAEFYQLDGLHEACNEYLSKADTKVYWIVGARYVSARSDIAAIGGDLVASAKEIFLTRATKEVVFCDVIPTLMTRDQCKSFSGFRLMAAVERFLRTFTASSGASERKMKMLGWKTATTGDGCLELMLLVQEKLNRKSNSPSQHSTTL